MRFLLDTCAIIWAVAQPDQLSSDAKAALEQPDARIGYSPLSCAEVSWSVDRGRLTLDRHWRLWFRHYIEINGWEEFPVNLSIVEEAYSLPGDFHADPVDRILVATSRLSSLQLITADRKILDYPHVRTLW